MLGKKKITLVKEPLIMKRNGMTKDQPIIRKRQNDFVLQSKKEQHLVKHFKQNITNISQEIQSHIIKRIVKLKEKNPQKAQTNEVSKQYESIPDNKHLILAVLRYKKIAKMKETYMSIYRRRKFGKPNREQKQTKIKKMMLSNTYSSDVGISKRQLTEDKNNDDKLQKIQNHLSKLIRKEINESKIKQQRDLDSNLDQCKKHRSKIQPNPLKLSAYKQTSQSSNEQRFRFTQIKSEQLSLIQQRF